MKQIYLFPGQWAYSDEAAELSTILGSCVGVALYDYKLRRGALNHYLLPELPPGEAASTRYGDIAMATILDAMLKGGSEKKSLQAKVYGGGSVLSGVTIGDGIGNRNVALALKFLEDNRIPVIEQNVGGLKGRKISFSTETFEVTHRVHGQDRETVDLTGFGVTAPAKNVRVLIVDDSATVRSLFQKIFKKHGIEVVGTAANAYEAREMIVKTKPDVITLDLEMPKMSGVIFLEKLMQHMPMPVVIVSSLGNQGEAALRTLELGAIEFIHKPSQYDPAILTQLGEMLVAKVKAAASQVPKAKAPVPRSPTASSPSRMQQAELKAILIGGNAGSTESLRKILEDLPADTPPVVVTNGTIVSFLETFLMQLKKRVSVQLSVAVQGEILKNGHVYFAPSDQQLRVLKSGAGFCLDLKTEAAVCSQLPSSTVLFESAASAMGAGAIGVLLGGFGNDGVEGLQKIRARGGVTFAQNPQEATFPYAPEAAVTIGIVDRILKADEISDAIVQQRNQRVAA